jgi:hypothetical protein
MLPPVSTDNVFRTAGYFFELPRPPPGLVPRPPPGLVPRPPPGLVPRPPPGLVPRPPPGLVPRPPPGLVPREPLGPPFAPDFLSADNVLLPIAGSYIRNGNSDPACLHSRSPTTAVPLSGVFLHQHLELDHPAQGREIRVSRK